MGPCGVFETRRLHVAILWLKFGFYILCNRIGQKTAQDLKVNICPHIYKQISPVVHFLLVTIAQKQEELSIYFLILQVRVI